MDCTADVLRLRDDDRFPSSFSDRVFPDLHVSLLHDRLRGLGDAHGTTVHSECHCLIIQQCVTH